MQKFSRRSRRTTGETTTTPPQAGEHAVTDAVDVILALTSDSPHPPETPGPEASAPTVEETPLTESPALSRRELREREAAVARRRTLFATESGAARARQAAPAIPMAAASVAATSVSSEPRIVAAPRASRKPRPIAISTHSTVPVRARVAGVRRRIAAKFASVGAMAGVALILVATTVPANAFVRPVADDATASVSAEADAGSTQELTVADATAPVVTRDAYTAVSQQQQFAAKAGNRIYSYTNNPAGTVQWPFPSGAPITSGFGPRHVAGCGFCSTYHQGLDFTPGSGYPINSIADGVVSLVEVSNSGLGNHVIVDHVVNGQKVQSVYGHMQYGSIKVAVGQAITVGQVIGNVGSTGASTGAHLHLEIHLDGTPIDPFAWLQANAN